MIHGEKIEIAKEQQLVYIALLTEYIRKTKDWEPEEYIVRYKISFPAAHLVSFDAVRYDALPDILDTTQRRLGFHPTGEVRLFIQTEEMRAFSDNEEFNRIVLETEEKETAKVA